MGGVEEGKGGGGHAEVGCSGHPEERALRPLPRGVRPHPRKGYIPSPLGCLPLLPPLWLRWGFPRLLAWLESMGQGPGRVTGWGTLGRGPPVGQAVSPQAQHSFLCREHQIWRNAAFTEYWATNTEIQGGRSWLEKRKQALDGGAPGLGLPRVCRAMVLKLAGTKLPGRRGCCRHEDSVSFLLPFLEFGPIWHRSHQEAGNRWLTMGHGSSRDPDLFL